MKLDEKKLIKYAAWGGFVLGIACHLLPPQYHELCQFVARLFTGGL